MSEPDLCPHCKINIPPWADVCPHCGKSLSPPNVRVAKGTEERAALEQRYRSAKADSAARGDSKALDDFEAALENSVAVIARPVRVLQQMVERDNAIYGTFYQMVEAELIFPTDDKWTRAREIADTILFPYYKSHVRFAALSMDGLGLVNYGECSVILRADMVSHRATVFEENSTLFMKHHRIKASEPENLPRGYRAAWEDRAKLCVAKLAAKINSRTLANEYPGILLNQGATTEDDEFVEVHVWGPMTVHTFDRVAISPRLNQNERATIVEALKYKLAKYGIAIS